MDDHEEKLQHQGTVHTLFRIISVTKYFKQQLINQCAPQPLHDGSEPHWDKQALMSTSSKYTPPEEQQPLQLRQQGQPPAISSMLPTGAPSQCPRNTITNHLGTPSSGKQYFPQNESNNATNTQC